MCQRFYLTLQLATKMLKLVQRRILSKYTYIGNQKCLNELVMDAKLALGDQSHLS